jgi:ferredoxin
MKKGFLMKIETHLKTVRKGVALLFLLLISLVFIDFNGLFSEQFISTVLFFQFIPSVLKCAVIAGIQVGGCVVVLLMTILFGRIYCSFLCPFGISMDVIARIFGAYRKKVRFSPPHTGLRYAILGITIISLALGSMGLINLLDPYSNYGRLMVILIKPVFIIFNNTISLVLEWMDIYCVTPMVQPGATIPLFIYTGSFIGGTFYLAVKKGRLYCNTLCPVGALLGLFSAYSFFKPRIDKKSCIGCGQCASLCKSSCIDVSFHTIDTSRCVNCFNCFGVCPEKSISYFRQRGKRDAGQEENPDSQRRSFLVAMMFIFLGISKTASAITRPLVYVKNKIPVFRKCPITPPGSLSVSHFTTHCTACHLCVTACPGKVIQPKLTGFGIRGFLMPAMVNRFGYCNFSCTRCGDICPSGAILPTTREEKNQIQIGQVKFIRENCIVITQKTDCGACSEHCPTKAVFMVVDNNLRVPDVNPDICVGCGACEYACPAIPHKAIYVEGNPVHRRAEKPALKEPEGFDANAEFPF